MIVKPHELEDIPEPRHADLGGILSMTGAPSIPDPPRTQKWPARLEAQDYESTAPPLTVSRSNGSDRLEKITKPLFHQLKFFANVD